MLLTRFQSDAGTDSLCSLVNADGASGLSQSTLAVAEDTLLPARMRSIAASAGRKRLKVVLFCGGRGSASIIRELIRRPELDLTLLVNAYDDGLSTGELRKFIPNMLGPSDFRKNLSGLLDLSSIHQQALHDVLEFRLPEDFSATHVAHVIRYLEHPRSESYLQPELRRVFRELDRDSRKQITSFLKRFFEYYGRQRSDLNLANCSFGNLIFAGCYFACNEDFNSAVSQLAKLFRSQARLVNVSKGENRTLVALKVDGQILNRESEIVGPQSAASIHDFFFLEHALSPEQLKEVTDWPISEKQRFLQQLSRDVELSEQADEALLHADLILYGPGTQFSSLLPSYGIASPAIRRSRASAKIFVANLERDHDIQSLTTAALVDKVLERMGDPENQLGVITHILVNGEDPQHENPLPFWNSGPVPGTYKSALVLKAPCANPVKPKVHSGYAVTRLALEIHRSATRASLQSESLDIYFEPQANSSALDYVVQEFLELPWREQFAKVTLRLNRAAKPEIKVPPYLEIASTQYARTFSEVEMVSDWLRHGTSNYLVTISGDGEYHLSDILLGARICKSGEFGALLGSRTQSRKQFRSSLRSAYGQRPILYALSWLGTFVLTGVLGLRCHTVLSDPLTGFRMYSRTGLTDGFHAEMDRRSVGTAVGIVRLMLRNSVEIAEIPVTYRTFAHFTRPFARTWRGFRNLVGALSW